MQKKKLLLMIILVAVLIVGWIAAVQASTATKVEDEQRALVEKADMLAAKELYVRAIPAYLDALDLDTDENTAIEVKLLASYLASGRLDAYCTLVERRIKGGVLEIEECRQASELYLSMGQLEAAVKLLEKGIAATEDAALIELYEANRYRYTVRKTGYDEILPSADNTVMLGRLGEEWRLLNPNARPVLKASYAFATAPNDSGFFVIRANDTFYCLNADGERYSVDEVGLDEIVGISSRFIIAAKDGKYGYYNADFQLLSESLQFDALSLSTDGHAAACRSGKWGIVADSGSIVQDFIFDEVAFNALGGVFTDGAGMVKYSGQWYLVAPSGAKLNQNGFTAAKAPESTGYVAVANAAGKWGFIDRAGNLKIDYKYDDALSFSDGVGAVCVDGKWGYISERGTMVIEPIFDAASPFHGGIAQGRTPEEGVVLIVLTMPGGDA